MALDAARRLLALDPADAAARDAVQEIQAEIQDGEVEQLCAAALTYAADGEFALAKKIADKIGAFAPDNPKLPRLSAYLDEEAGRRAAIALLASARCQCSSPWATSTRCGPWPRTRSSPIRDRPRLARSWSG